MNKDAASRKVLCNIAQSAFAAINRLLEKDQLLAENLRSDTTQSRQIYREECITVEMATSLLEQFPNHVEMILFTPGEEKKNGADWYWRFDRGDKSIHAYVQAKRVQRSEFGQDDSRGSVDINSKQLSILIDETETMASRMPGLKTWFATFARFNACPPCGKKILADCQKA